MVYIYVNASCSKESAMKAFFQPTNICGGDPFFSVSKSHILFYFSYFLYYFSMSVPSFVFSINNSAPFIFLGTFHTRQEMVNFLVSLHTVS